MASTLVPTTSIDGRLAVDLRAAFGPGLSKLPWSLRIVLENALRNSDRDESERAASDLRGWLDAGTSTAEIAFFPHRLLMHDTTCVPALVDIAGMRDALAEAGVDPRVLNPRVPVDVSVDHSIAVDAFGVPDAARINLERERHRNRERFELMKWAQHALDGFRVHPPGTGILHTFNLEQLATIVATADHQGRRWMFPDTLIGTDSHTPMINGIGVLAWGVGGLEAEGVLFGLPVLMRLPEVIGVRLKGALTGNTLATDVALFVTERLRRHGVSGEFVEFFGRGMQSLSAGERSVIANMAPEFGATTAYFPIDARSLSYLGTTGRPRTLIDRVERYARAQSLFFDPDETPTYTDVIEIDLSAIRTSVSGPRRPQDRIDPSALPATIDALTAPLGRSPWPAVDGLPPDGAVALAAITSCTNTTEPRLLIAAGLIARKARGLGIRPRPWVKTSFSPGSPAAARYLARTGLLEDLEELGFGIVGFGCMTCIGNSGPLSEPMDRAVRMHDVLPVAVLSGNRNFPGRVHAQIDAAFLASPPLVVAFALAGDANRNILSDPIAESEDGQPIRLDDLWPSGEEIDRSLAEAMRADDFVDAFADAEKNPSWADLLAPVAPQFDWDSNSTDLRRPPFASWQHASRIGTLVAAPLIVLGDDVTTDQISPAGAIPRDSAAAAYLVGHGQDVADLNVYASRRGNFEVMVRGLFTNRAVVNLLADDLRPGFTVHSSGDAVPLAEAATRYARDGLSTVIVAGERYGAGSSRDWAAKGPALLGVRAVLASSFERIHRQNLIGMGILPLVFPKSLHPADLCLEPSDRFEFEIPRGLEPRQQIRVSLKRGSTMETFDAAAAIETALEAELIELGGIIPYILDRAIRQQARADKQTTVN